MSAVLVNQASARNVGTHRILEAREQRGRVRQELARSLTGRSLVELALDVPGGPEGDETFARLFQAGLQSLEAELGVAPAAVLEDAAGYQAVFISELPALLTRRRASRIEQQAPWSRPLSIECYGITGSLGTTSKVPRETVGASFR
jgi:phosphoribosyl-dephospho-CoA transferase